MAAPLAGSAAPQFGAAAAQISHPAMAYQPMMMGAQQQVPQKAGGLLGNMNPAQLNGLLNLLKQGNMGGGGMQFMGTLPGGTVNYGSQLGAAAAQGLNPEMAMGGL